MAANVSSLAKDLAKEALDNVDPSAERCGEIIAALDKDKTKVTLEVLEKTGLGKIITKSIKAMKRHKRTADEATTSQWDEAITNADQLLTALKKAAAAETAAAQRKKKAAAQNAAQQPGLPTSSSAYKSRLESQKKEMYKNPPAMPPATIKIDKKSYGLPKRDKASGELTFQGGGSDIKSMLKDFKPNRTPEEVLRAGSFGGTYYRPIVSAVTNVRYSAAEVLKDSVDPSWIEGLNKAKMLNSSTYRTEVNKYGVKCGGSLGMWESSGWISDSDPYGWFQWYCRFYQGRRCSDDARQISRWLKSAGPKGRFRSQLCNKVLAARTSHDDTSISPVVRQTLLHWGLEITPQVLEKHRKRVGA